MKRIILISIFASAFFMSESYSQQLVYRAKNPFFGGDTFNYQFLLQSAQSQNSFSDPAAGLQDDRSDLERFTESLNNQLLNQLSRTLFTQQFGVNGELRPGTFSFGSLVLEIFESSEG